MVNLTTLLCIALFIEAIVDSLKPLWDREAKISAAEIVSMALGVVLAVACRIDVLDYIVDWRIASEAPGWIAYVFYVLSGIAIGRGPSFLYDLWKSVRTWIENHEGAMY